MGPGVTHLILHNVTWQLETIDAFGEGCPNVKSFTCLRMRLKWENFDVISSLMCHWLNLRHVSCPQVALSVAAASHLSRLPNLDYLHFILRDEVMDWIQSRPSGASIQTFTTLRRLSLCSKSLASAWSFLHHLRLPMVDDLNIDLRVIPTELELLSFVAQLQETCAHDTLREFGLILCEDAPNLSDSEFDWDAPQYHITFDHLHPLTVFVNIRSIAIGYSRSVDLNERDMLSLAASWPHLEEFTVCDKPCWTESSGITPWGFVRLLEICRSLRSFHFKFDVRSYTETPRGHPWRGLSMPKRSYLNLQNTPIEEESVYPLGVFFHVAQYPDFQIATHWDDPDFQDGETPEELGKVYGDRWERVYELASELWEEREELRRSLLTWSSDNDVL